MPHLTTYSFSLDNSKQASFLSSVLCDQLKAHFPQLQSVFLSQSAKFTCITISGTTNDVNSAKQDLLKLQPVEVNKTIVHHMLLYSLFLLGCSLNSFSLSWYRVSNDSKRKTTRSIEISCYES